MIVSYFNPRFNILTAPLVLILALKKKNEEAFLRAIEISKQKFSDCCGTWRNRVNQLLSNMPHHAQKFGNLNVSNGFQYDSFMFQ